MKKESRSSRDCFRIANTCLELARHSNKSWEVEHHCVTGITFVAFAMESMLNHFGQILFDDWNKKRGARKKLHKQLFKSVNLPDYLGSNIYQKARSCFFIRDELAHGKTKEESINTALPDGVSHGDTILHLTTLATEQVKKVNVELLEEYILVAKIIESDIQENGYYPDQEHLPLEMREKLIECPLDADGVCTW